MVEHSSPAVHSRREICVLLAACAAGAARWAAADAPEGLNAAREALERGDAAHALELYESLVRQSESLDVELGLIRAALRAGEFRKAVANANHTAGEHPESAEAAALLAYITDRSARTEQALAALGSLQAARPGEWVPIAAHAEVLIDRLAPDQAVTLIESWLAQRSNGERPAELSRLLQRARASAGNPALGSGAPQPWQQSWVAAGFQALPVSDAGITSAGNGVVVDAGRSVLTYAGTLSGAKRLSVRNGLGQLRQASLEPRTNADGDLVRLRLDAPYPAEWSIAPEQVAAPESVRFCFVFSFGAPHSGDAAYPAITPGVVVHADTGIGGLMQITSQLGRGHNGAPVFDARGQLIGVSLASGDHSIAGQDVRKALGPGGLALRVDRALLRGASPAAPSTPLPPMPAVEELYERLVPAIVQVVGAA